MQLDVLLPDYDFNEVHQTLVPAPPLQADAALRSLDMSETPLVSFLMFLRELPARLTGQTTITQNQKEFSGENKNTVGKVFYDTPGEETAFGFIGRPWKLAEVDFVESIRTCDEFTAFSQPGYVKVAANYTFRAVKGGTCVRTESRIAATDRYAALRFLPYWIIIRIPSGLIRRSMLAALHRKVGHRLQKTDIKTWMLKTFL